MNFLTPGMRLMLLGTFFFSLGSLFIKLAGTRLPTMEILFVRGVVGVGMCLFMLRKSGAGMLGKRKVLLAARGLLGFGAMFADFYAIVHLPLADALVLIFAHPVTVGPAGLAAHGRNPVQGRYGRHPDLRDRCCPGLPPGLPFRLGQPGPGHLGVAGRAAQRVPDLLGHPGRAGPGQD